jgi:glycosyltransferase involved in cell wall biosynthesis
MIHIVYIITKLELGGAQKVVLTLFRGVSAPQFTASLVAGKGGVLDATLNKEDKVTLLPDLQRDVSLGGFFREIKSWCYLVQSLRSLRKQYPQLIVHTHSTKAGLLGRWAAWFAGVKTRVHTIHGYAFHDHQSSLAWWAIYFLEWVTSFITTHFVSVSSYDYQLGCRLFLRFKEKATMIRAAISWDDFYGARALARPKVRTPFVFGTVACFKPQKNIFDTLRAFHMVAQHSDDVWLEIIGDGAQRPHIESWIKEYNIQDRVIVSGWCHDVPARMAKWHAFVLTSLWEGLPCSVIEARVLQLPVLAYNTGGISDVITHNVNGCLYSQGGWRHMAQDMLRLVHDDEWYTRLAFYGDQLQDFHDNEMIAQHRRLYERLLAQQKSLS